MKDEDWKRGAQDSVGLQCEYGSAENVRFLSPQQVTMYDSRGNPVYCACGKPAGCAAIGVESSIAWCSECSPLHQTEAELIYKKPEASGVHNQVLTDSWVVNMREGEQNGDTDWYDPTITPADGEPIYFKVEIMAKGYYLPQCKVSQWMAESYEEKVVSWQKREDGKNYHEKEVD